MALTHVVMYLRQKVNGDFITWKWEQNSMSDLGVWNCCMERAVLVDSIGIMFAGYWKITTGTPRVEHVYFNIAKGLDLFWFSFAALSIAFFDWYPLCYWNQVFAPFTNMV